MDADLEAIFPTTFDALYGLVVDGIDLEAGEAHAHVEIGPHHRQPLGQVHGGVLASMAEALTSLATYRGVHADGRIAVGQSNHASFLRPLTDGTIHARALVRHRGRTTWIWDVELTDDAQRLCAIVRMTIAVRPPAPGR
jgi:1,4-dihydroxy-2-naphthoyl-CoA hydrolase